MIFLNTILKFTIVTFDDDSLASFLELMYSGGEILLISTLGYDEEGNSD